MTLEETINSLLQNEVNPMTDNFLILSKMRRYPSRPSAAPYLANLDNRRLYCLKECQKRCPSVQVFVRLRVFEWRPEHYRFLKRDLQQASLGKSRQV